MSNITDGDYMEFSFGWDVPREVVEDAIAVAKTAINGLRATVPDEVDIQYEFEPCSTSVRFKTDGEFQREMVHILSGLLREALGPGTFEVCAMRAGEPVAA